MFTDRLISFLQRLVRRHPRLIVAAFAVLFAFAGVMALQVEVAVTSDGLMSTTDPAYLASKELKKEFSNDEILVVGFELGGTFSADDLRKLAVISERLGDIKGVDEVVSLANIEDVRAGDVGMIDASPLVDVDELEDTYEAIVERVRGHPIYTREVISEDLDAFGLVVRYEPPDAQKHNTRATTVAVMELLDASSPWPHYLTGYPIQDYDAYRRVQSDLMVLGVPVFLVILLIFWFVARRLSSLFILSALVAWTTVSAIGLFGALGMPMNPITSGLQPILLATSGAYGIYLLGLVQRHRDDPEPDQSVLRIVTRPALLSAISTAGGFLAMAFIDIEALRHLAFGLAFGILAALVATLLLLPALVRLTNLRPPPVRYAWLERFALLGVRWARRPWIVLGAAAMVIAIAIPGIVDLKVKTDPLSFFPDDSTPVRGHDFATRELTGAGVVNVVLRGQGPNGALDPALMGFAKRVIDEVEAMPAVGFTRSSLDYFELIDAALNPDRPARAVPSSKALAAQYLVLYDAGGDPNDFSHVLSFDRSAMNISVRLSDFTSPAVSAVAARVHELASEAPAGVGVEVLGTIYVMARSVDTISGGVIRGLVATIVVVFIVFLTLLRSLKLSLIGLFPNMLPIVLWGAVMGYAGIDIDVATSIIGLIAIGLAVDDTSHVLAHVRPDVSLEAVYREVGMPLTLTTASLGAGFLLMRLSNFEAIGTLGVGTALTLVAALIADLLVLPSLLTVCGYRRVETEAPAPTAANDEHAAAGARVTA